MFRLNNHVFVSFYNSSFLFDFSIIWTIIHIVGTAILSRTNVDCVLLASMLNIFFCLIGKTLCPAKAIIRGVFRTLSTMMELLVKIRYGFYLHHSFLTGSWIHPWSWYSIFFSNQTSLQNLVFLENCYKKGDMSYDFTFG